MELKQSNSQAQASRLISTNRTIVELKQGVVNELVWQVDATNRTIVELKPMKAESSASDLGLPIVP